MKKCLPKSETDRHLGVHRLTVKRYCKQLDERDTLEPRKKAPGKAPKLGEKASKYSWKTSKRGPTVDHPLLRGQSSCSPSAG